MKSAGTIQKNTEKRASHDVLFSLCENAADRLILLVLLGSVLLFILWPIACIALRSLRGADGGVSFAMFGTVLRQYGESLRNSVFVGVFTAVLSTILSLSAALVCATARGWKKTLCMVIMLVAMVSPPFVSSLAYIQLYGRRGWITYRLLHLSWNPYNCWGIILMQSISFVPLNAMFLSAILEKLDIGYFFYIGGNDSMDTIGKLAEYGECIQSDIRFMGVPKTIDNDLMVTDHTPGYGSAAKYIGVVMKEIIRDATVYGTKYVTVVEIMGRNAGWLTAAAALAKSDDCEGVDMICLPEVPFNVEHFIEKVRVMQEKKPSIVIAVSEGVKLEDGRYVCELADDVHAVDAFGHKALTGTARYLANVVARNLDTKTRCIELSTLQRCAGHLTSRTDITEAYQVGGAAAKAAFEGVTGQMVALKRISNSPYQCTTELHPISEVANLEKKVPLSWMNENHTQMTEDFLAYARPLIQAELTPLYIAGLPHHIYMKHQK